MKCQSRILREYKSRKAESVPPELGDGRPTPHAVGLPECGGAVTVAAIVEQEPYYGGCTYVLALEIKCSRCKFPFIRGYQALRHDVAMRQRLDVTKLLEEAANEG